MSADDSNLRTYIEKQVASERPHRLRGADASRGFSSQAAVDFFAQKGREFYWTVTRLVGLGHLHDGVWNFRLWNKALRRFLATHSAGAAAPPGSRVFIEVSQLLFSDKATGIQRVTLEVCRAALRHGGVPVFAFEGSLYGVIDTGKDARPIEVSQGDKYIVAGAWWATPGPVHRAMQDISARGGRNIVILYDLFPLQYNEICFRVENFVAWFNRVVLASDAVVCISRSVADEFIELMAAERRPFNPALRLGWQGLGADFSGGTEKPSREVVALCGEGAPLLLSVSTLEPRKGYPIALDAFDKLWREGVDVRYVIVGREGWMVSALKQRIFSHPEYGRRLFWLSNASDADLRHLYGRAHSLVFATIAEGFGLALVEAAYYGLPAIVTDIPVFREIAGDSVRYFDLGDSDMLAQQIRDSLAAPKTPPAIPLTSWEEATDRLLAMIAGEAYQYGELRERIAAIEPAEGRPS